MFRETEVFEHYEVELLTTFNLVIGLTFTLLAEKMFAWEEDFKTILMLFTEKSYCVEKPGDERCTKIKEHFFFYKII